MLEVGKVYIVRIPGEEPRDLRVFLNLSRFPESMSATRGSILAEREVAGWYCVAVIGPVSDIHIRDVEVEEVTLDVLKGIERDWVDPYHNFKTWLTAVVLSQPNLRAEVKEEYQKYIFS